MALTPFHLLPECSATPRTSTLKKTNPMCATVTEPFDGSQTTAASALWPESIAAREPFPPPSSSTTERICTSPGSGIPASCSSFTPSTEARSPPFISHVPSPHIFPSRICASRGSKLHSSLGPDGMVSICPSKRSDRPSPPLKCPIRFHREKPSPE